MTEPEWKTEWAVEVTWRDWQAAGAKGPTSQYAVFSDRGHVDRYLRELRRDRDIAATRILERQAAYTAWVGPEKADPTTEEEREALLAQLADEMRRP